MSEIPGQLELDLGLDEQPPADEPQPDAMTAFLVVVNFDGTAAATADLEAALTVERTATLADMRRASLEVAADIAAMHTAEQVLAALKESVPAAPADRVRRSLAIRRAQQAG